MLPFDVLIGKLEQQQPWQVALTVVCFLALLVIALYCKANWPETEKQFIRRYLIFAPISCGLALVILAAQDAPSKQVTKYVMTHDRTHVFFKSKTKYLESATFKIIGQDKTYVYAEYENDVYRIPQSKLE